MADIRLTDPAVGRSYWWLRVREDYPDTLTVKAIDPDGITFFLQDPYVKGLREVTWTWAEWGAARPKLNDALDPVTGSDLGPDEKVCDACNGTRWEKTQTSEVVGCIWCNFTGRKKRPPPPPPPEPTTTRRSPYHPEVPK